MVGTHKWLYAHYTHPDVILDQFINVRLIDGWNAQMTLCSLHPPRRHIGSVYQRYNWWLERTNDSMLITPTQTSYWISLSTFYNWWLERTNDSMLITPNPDVKLNQFINVPIIDGWDAQMTLCSLHPPRRHVESVYQRCYNWWLERTNESMLITPTQTSRWISLFNVQRYNWWLERTNDSMLITPTQTSYWISLSTFL